VRPRSLARSLPTPSLSIFPSLQRSYVIYPPEGPRPPPPEAVHSIARDNARK